ncbi:hypothetical protein L1987_12508 [Smallanthus sonchifolius]|uniref:Uncharacterized protein n=1 Tax=Smallanthus sonchifolius TaxID=185202 RepID=A0ACB9JDY4_9ASTR|nr:hypothetical protein L1987_12508 [Smallanthus sonchifolius]
MISEDPFSIYKVIDHLDGVGFKNQEIDAPLSGSLEDDGTSSVHSSFPSKPPGFEEFVNQEMAFKHLGTDDVSMGSPSVTHHSKTNGGSLLHDLSKVIEMGRIMGFDMDGTSGDLEKFIKRMSEKVVGK